MNEPTKIKGEEIERITCADVRLDNWVLSYLNKKPMQIDWLAIKHLSDGNVQAAFYDHSPVYVGIHLTPEILEKCGFVNNGQGVFDKENWIPFLKPYRGIYQVMNVADCYVEHLHQLQNLYFALTGKELTYNP